MKDANIEMQDSILKVNKNVFASKEFNRIGNLLYFFFFYSKVCFRNKVELKFYLLSKLIRKS